MTKEPKPRLEDLSDGELVQLILKGDVGRPWEVLLKRYLRMAIEAAYQVVKQNHPEREDVAQDIALESLAKAHFHLGSYDPSMSFGAWLRTIARRTAHDYARKEYGPDYSRRLYLSDQLDDCTAVTTTPVEQLIDSEEWREVKHCFEEKLRELSQEQRQLLRERYHKCLTVEKMAQQRELEEQTVRGNLTRAKQTFLAMLGLPINLTNGEVVELFHAVLGRPTATRKQPRSAER